MKHLFNKKAASAYKTWVMFTNRSIGVRNLIKRMKYGAVMTTFDAWRTDTLKIKEEKRKLIAPIYNRIVNRLLVLTFLPWKVLWERALRGTLLMLFSFSVNVSSTSFHSKSTFLLLLPLPPLSSVKNMIRRSMMGRVAYCYEVWSDNVIEIITERNTITKIRTDSSILIQKIARSYILKNNPNST